MSRLKSKTRKVSLQISNVSSLQASNLRMAEPFLTTTSRKNQLYTWCSGLEVACRSSSKLSQERPSPWKLSPVTPLRMSKPRFKIRKASPQISNVSSLLASSLRTVEPSQITTSRKNRLSISSSAFEAASRCHLRAAVNEYPPSAADSSASYRTELSSRTLCTS